WEWQYPRPESGLQPSSGSKGVTKPGKHSSASFSPDRSNGRGEEYHPESTGELARCTISPDTETAASLVSSGVHVIVAVDVRGDAEVDIAVVDFAATVEVGREAAEVG